MSIEELPAVPKKKWRERKKMVVASIVVFSIIITLVTAYFLTLTGSVACSSTPTVGTNKASNATTVYWTITSLSGCGGSWRLQKSDVYVTVKNASGVIKIIAEPLSQAMNIQGFNYTPHPPLFSDTSYISVGDVFSLDKTLYKSGSALILVSKGATGQYCHLTV